MATFPASIVSLFQAFYPGKTLIDGGDLKNLVNQLFSSATGIVAAAGGTQALATQLSAAFNEVGTVANANDSVALPLALPGASCYINNATATSLQVFGAITNPSNAGAGDTLAAYNSIVQQPTATGVAQAGSTASWYVCTTLGQWKQSQT